MSPGAEAKDIKKTIKETMMYRPIAALLESRDFVVRGEVKGFDITAIRGDELVAVEMKRRMGLEILLQATQRQRIADSVYVAVPLPEASIRSRKWRRVSHLLKRLDLGLIFVSFPALSAPSASAHGTEGVAEVIFHPVQLKRHRNRKGRRAVLEEIHGRSGDHNVGGSSRRKIMTAYRETSLKIACCLSEFGSLSPKALRNLGTGPKTQPILYNNHYGWFTRLDRALYGITKMGRRGLAEYHGVIEDFKKALSEHQDKRKPKAIR